MSNEMGPEIPGMNDVAPEVPTPETHHRISNPENKSPIIEDPEKRKQPGQVIPSVRSGERHFAVGTIVRDENDRLAQVTNFTLVEDADNYKWDADPSIRRPKKMKNPELSVRYQDGLEKIFLVKPGISRPVYADSKIAIQENEDFFDQSHLEIRGHDFRLGEFVSFGNGAGRLALIVPNDNPQFGIVAQKERGQGGLTDVWLVSANEVDYIVHEDDGAIRRYPDNTLYKPTLGNPEFDQNPEI